MAALAGAVAVIDQVAALNINRREHKLEKKENPVVWETVEETVYVYGNAPATGSRPAGGDKVADVVVNPTPPKNEVHPVQKDQAPAPIKPATTKPATSKPATPPGTGSTGVSSKRPGFSGKRGLAYNDPRLANLVGSSCKSGACGWATNWGQSEVGLSPNRAFIPMLWGKGPHNGNNDFFDSWHSNARKAVANGAKALLSFNEPDNKGQANMSPAEAAKHHVEYMNPYAGQTLIGSPSITNSNLQGEGLDWLKSWVQECKSQHCEYHYCATHWYDHASAINTLFEHIKQVHDICDGKPVWLTEFAPIEATTAQTEEFLSQAIPKLESIDHLDAYAYFMVGSGANQLLSSDSALSPIGNKYVSL
ncbi:hypothetical protein EsDP_00004316 [Epichloe bromicola]|uniref:Asl1-like glycosyl hydrolase catalytic domain-containing protein n=1 Tax=Epichloe bromicola TaxID=79588 RepID=A0ABQ0CRH8_9HYPO